MTVVSTLLLICVCIQVFVIFVRALALALSLYRTVLLLVYFLFPSWLSYLLDVQYTVFQTYSECYTAKRVSSSSSSSPPPPSSCVHVVLMVLHHNIFTFHTLTRWVCALCALVHFHFPYSFFFLEFFRSFVRSCVWYPSFASFTNTQHSSIFAMTSIHPLVFPITVAIARWQLA